MGSDENELAAAMRTSASGLVPPTGLVAGGIARGRRMKLVRRIQVGVSTAAVLAVASTTLLVVANGNDDHRGRVAGPASTTAEVSAPAIQAGPKPRPTLTVPAGTVPVLPPLLLHKLLALVPQNLLTSRLTGSDNTNRTSAGIHSAGASASFVLEDSAGPSLLSVSVAQDAETPETVECPHPGGEVYAKCVNYEAPAGRVVERQDWVYPAAPDTPENRADGKAGPWGNGPKVWSVRVVRRDGVVITIEEIASREEKGDIGRNTPILSMDRLRAIATDPTWQLWVASDANKAAADASPKIGYRSPFGENYQTPPSTSPSPSNTGAARSENGAGAAPGSGVPSGTVVSSRS
ncbi:hypothetical protein OG948_26820 [Embleya sp. NBC_00888]|uniref:hypothetical protein n=1 Tax=Embleya sp. NBC_00888 TaxID=2975960 RepID=UPI00386C6C83|nr:hypothetical protein OG948_26820 [Embleya sp. NBC_00888]